ncbi:hypothetical protein [Serratia sp. MF2]|uniref:hypothetical protein n=1 Tax=Serratia sp. MF2 TaxID=3059173 RepID=UPI0027E6C7C1|nr:hypothetical protein [Serratia sp. MF2]MDQ7101925.1 hypothetical protein [Serratia sp. MF2]
MDNKLSELSKPVAYSLRFRNMHTGEPDKTINANTTFSTLEKAKAYGLGSGYVTQDDGKIVSVRDPSQDPIVEPLYSQEYVSALDGVAQFWIGESAGWKKRVEDAEKRIAELEGQLQSGFTPEALAQEERAENAEQRVSELEAKLAAPKPPEKCPCCNRRYTLESYAHGECAICGEAFDANHALRSMGFTVEGDE